MPNGFSLSMPLRVFGLMVLSLCIPDLGLAQGRAGSAPMSMPNPAMNSGAPATDLTASHNSRFNNTDLRRNDLSEQDKNFIAKAAQGGLMEIDGGKIAVEKGQNTEVRTFGHQMVTDHSKANADLRAIAARKGMGLPSGGTQIVWKSDKKYMDMMVKDHEEDLAEFRQEAKNGSDSDVRMFAQRNAKVIEKHLALAREIDGKVK